MRFLHAALLISFLLFGCSKISKEKRVSGREKPKNEKREKYEKMYSGTYGPMESMDRLGPMGRAQWAWAYGPDPMGLGHMGWAYGARAQWAKPIGPRPNGAGPWGVAHGACPIGLGPKALGHGAIPESFSNHFKTMLGLFPLSLIHI